MSNQGSEKSAKNWLEISHSSKIRDATKAQKIL
jgi:hypothetical protein